MITGVVNGCRVHDDIGQFDKRQPGFWWAIRKQKRERPEPGKSEAYEDLEPVLAAKSIDWVIIRQQYDRMVKYATGLRLGTAQTESVLRRCTKSNVQHPL